jgi:unsaturated rhamnogalacturonyl hydrolase
MNKSNLVIILLIFAACKQPAGEATQSAGNANAASPPLYVRMADSELKRNPDPRLLDFREKPKWEYTNGLLLTSLLKVWEKTGDRKYFNYARSYADSMILDDGNIVTYKKSDYNIDRVNPGKFLMVLYEETGTPKYKRAVDTLRQQMREHPRTSEGGFWHKKVYPHQMWLDGLYMGSPFLAQYAAEFNEPALFDDVAKQIHLIDKYTYDEETGLYYHGWDESKEQQWADPETGLSPNFWGRAMGWFSMALVDVLDFLPENHPKRPEVLKITRRLAEGIIRHQDDESGVWYQVVDQPKREGNYKEASASSMFTYFLLKGVNNGYLDSSFHDNAIKGYNGLLEEFIRYEDDGTVSLTNVCSVAGLGGNPYRSGSYEYYISEPKRDNDPKGVGPFIMASLEFEKANSL